MDPRFLNDTKNLKIQFIKTPIYSPFGANGCNKLMPEDRNIKPSGHMDSTITVVNNRKTQETSKRGPKTENKQEEDEMEAIDKELSVHLKKVEADDRQHSHNPGINRKRYNEGGNGRRYRGSKGARYSSDRGNFRSSNKGGSSQGRRLTITCFRLIDAIHKLSIGGLNNAFPYLAPNGHCIVYLNSFVSFII